MAHCSANTETVPPYDGGTSADAGAREAEEEPSNVTGSTKTAPSPAKRPSSERVPAMTTTRPATFHEPTTSTAPPRTPVSAAPRLTDPWPTADVAGGADTRGGWSARHALVTVGGGVHLMLDEASGEALAHGPPRLADRRSFLVHAAIPDDQVPARARAWRGRRVEVVTDRGVRCAASVRAFEYRVDLIPAFDDELGWDGTATDPEPPRPPLRGRALAQAVWDGSATRAITARLRLDDPGACRGTPLYARDVSEPATRIARPLSRVPRRAAVLKAFEALPAYAAAQAQYAAMLRELAEDDSYPARWDAERTPAVQAFAFAKHEGTLVSVSVPWEGCSGEDWALWAVFRVTADRPPELVEASTTLVPARVLLILDAGEHGLDYIVDDGFPGGTRVVRNTHTLASWAPEFHGCSC